MDSRHHKNVRDQVLGPVIIRMTREAEFRAKIAACREDALLVASLYEPLKPYTEVLGLALPEDVRKLKLNHDELQTLSLNCNLLGLLAGSSSGSNTLSVHPFELMPAATKGEHWIKKGETILGQGLMFNAILCFDRALQLSPKHVGALIGKAKALYKLGTLITPSHQGISPRALYRVWTHLLNLGGAITEAIGYLDDAIRLSPASVEAHFTRGICFIELGRPSQDWQCVDRARRCFEKVLELDPAHERARACLAMCGSK